MNGQGSIFLLYIYIPAFSCSLSPRLLPISKRSFRMKTKSKFYQFRPKNRKFFLAPPRCHRHLASKYFLLVRNTAREIFRGCKLQIKRVLILPNDDCADQHSFVESHEYHMIRTTSYRIETQGLKDSCRTGVMWLFPYFSLSMSLRSGDWPTKMTVHQKKAVGNIQEMTEELECRHSNQNPSPLATLGVASCFQNG